ncbi:MAG TPA: phosphopantothenoylcysteine decarboxylase [Tepidisphaeraceae bacterium]|nr:phosphopantothenoylcysteine decarboxylase [Tepidisphaeraceae bacterium]
MRFLVTAGNTREMIDSVRAWSSIFTGNTGLSIAKAISVHGQVDLLTSNQQHIAEMKAQAGAVHATWFGSHADLRDLLEKKVRENSYDAIFMSAAVADYKPARVYAVVSKEPDPSAPGRERWIVQDVQAGKVKSNHSAIAILGEQTEKLVDLFRKRWNYRGLLVKFKLEVGIGMDDLIRIGQVSRNSSGAEYLVANTLEMTQGANAGAYLLSDRGSEWVPRAALASRLARLIAEEPSLHQRQ